MSQFLKGIQPTLNEIVYDLTGLTVREREKKPSENQRDFSFSFPIDSIRIKNYSKIRLFIEVTFRSKRKMLINIFKGNEKRAFSSLIRFDSIRLKKKFYVHAQDRKGDLLEYLVKHFYNRPLLGHGPEVKDESSSRFFFSTKTFVFQRVICITRVFNWSSN